MNLYEMGKVSPTDSEDRSNNSVRYAFILDAKVVCFTAYKVTILKDFRKVQQKLLFSRDNCSF